MKFYYSIPKPPIDITIHDRDIYTFEGRKHIPFGIYHRPYSVLDEVYRKPIPRTQDFEHSVEFKMIENDIYNIILTEAYHLRCGFAFYNMNSNIVTILVSHNYLIDMKYLQADESSIKLLVKPEGTDSVFTIHKECSYTEFTTIKDIIQ